jgi:hypothetical protein
MARLSDEMRDSRPANHVFRKGEQFWPEIGSPDQETPQKFAALAVSIAPNHLHAERQSSVSIPGIGRLE